MLTYNGHGEQPEFVTSMIGKIASEAQRSTNAAFACAWGKFFVIGTLGLALAGCQTLLVACPCERT
jgi:hypothetical protein